MMAILTGGSRVAVEITDAQDGHTIFLRLPERGELAPYLQRTIIAELDDELIEDKMDNAVLTFPNKALQADG